MKLRVLIIGSGGREHALAWKLAESPRLGKLYVAPGNPGTAEVAENVPIDADDVKGLVAFALKAKINFTVVGPDDVLARGTVDAFQKEGLEIFGPTQAAAQIEASKAYAKEVMTKRGVPTADYKTFDDLERALEYIKKATYPLFIKASGLALGKGAVRAENAQEAARTLRDMMSGERFGAAGKTVVIESYLDGPEMSLHALCDGKTYRVFPSSQDHKPVLDGNKGPNTGGMGTVAPLFWVSPEDVETMGKAVVEPILKDMRAEGHPFKGLLYPGMKLTRKGPKVIEYNARFGDPETQVYMRLLDSDLLSVLLACSRGTLSKTELVWREQTAACIVLASGGYPDAYAKGKLIEGIAKAEELDGVKVFQAGTAMKDGQLVTNGGRVLGVTAVGDSLEEARTNAYRAVKRIRFADMHYRKDIGVVPRD